MSTPFAALNTPTRESSALIEKYQHSYRSAEAEIAFSKKVSFGGVVLGGVILISGVIEFLLNPAEHHGFPVIMAAMIAVGIFFAFAAQIPATIIRGEGELLRVTIDSAVNSSPFLSNVQKARGMTLPQQASMPEPLRSKAA